MKIHLVTPAKKNDRNGNRTTALRWAKLLQKQGHKVQVETDYNGEPIDLLIALHAWRSAHAIQRYKTLFPHGPLIVALGGTDVNTHLKTHPETTLKSMQLADVLVCLHDLIALELPLELRPKLRVIYQSANSLAQRHAPRSRTFDVCVIGNLREEKDPFRTAMAANLLPTNSKIRVVHFGKASNPEWRLQALEQMKSSPRYKWQGEVPGWRVRQELARTRLMVISSNQEGGANVVSEALVAGVAILASMISGNVGLLGADYPGYFPVGDEKALAELLNRAEADPKFLDSLEYACSQLAPGFMPEYEAEAWRKVIEEVQ